MSRKAIIGIVVAAGVAAVAAGGAVGLITRIEPGQQQRVIDIPPGAAAQIKKNPKSQIVPLRVKARVGERLIIKNRDRQAHQVGPFTVNPKSTLSYPLLRPGRYQGLCTLRPGKTFTLTVVD